MYVDKTSFIIYMITTYICIVTICIFLIKAIRKQSKITIIQNELIYQLKSFIKFDGILDEENYDNRRKK